MSSSLSAAVLAGGQSRRMGEDKALLDVEGVPLLARAVATLTRIADDVIVVGDRPAYHSFGAPVVADEFPGTGPLGGIATALRNAKHDFVLVVACDMPFLNVDVIRALANEPRTYQVLVPSLGGERGTQGRTKTLEALHAIYARSCLPVIEGRLGAGEYQVIGFYDDVSVRIIDEEWFRAIDPGLRSFVNTNNREQLHRAIEYGGSCMKDISRGDSAQ